MTIKKVEQLEDRVIIHFHFKNGERIPDDFEKKEILYSDIPHLPKDHEIQRDPGCINHWSEPVFIEKVNKTIIYYFKEWQETAYASMQGFEDGPFLVNKVN